MPDQSNTSGKLNLGWGGLRTPEAPKPVEAPAPSTTIYDDRFDEDRESRTETLTIQRERAEREGDSERVRLYSKLLQQRRLLRDRMPPISNLPTEAKEALLDQTDYLTTTAASDGIIAPPTLLERLHRVAWLASKGDLSMYALHVKCITLNNLEMMERSYIADS